VAGVWNKNQKSAGFQGQQKRSGSRTVMKTIVKFGVLAVFAVVLMGLTGCMSDPESRASIPWDRPDAGDYIGSPISVWNR
jgi:hypothetical protein